MSRAVFKKASGGRAPRVSVAGLVRLQFATVEEFLFAEAVDLSRERRALKVLLAPDPEPA